VKRRAQGAQWISQFVADRRRQLAQRCQTGFVDEFALCVSQFLRSLFNGFF
jgi:hypothetical protein